MTATEAYKQGNWADAVRICEEGIQAAESAGNELQACLLRITISQCNWAQGRIQQAFDVLPDPPKGQGFAEMEFAANIRNQKGFLLAETGKFQEAKAELDEALRLSELAGKDALTFRIQINRGSVFFYLTDYDSMLACGRVAIEIAEKNDLPLGSAYAGMAKSFMVQKRWTEAIAWYERAMSAFDADNCPFYVNCMRGELGNCHLLQGNLDKAMQFFSEALRYSESVNALSGMHTDHANLGAVYLLRGEYRTALAHFQKAMEIARVIGDEISTGKWLYNLSLAYRCLGDTAQSMRCALESERVNLRVAQARAACR